MCRTTEAADEVERQALSVEVPGVCQACNEDGTEGSETLLARVTEEDCSRHDAGFLVVFEILAVALRTTVALAFGGMFGRMWEGEDMSPAD